MPKFAKHLILIFIVLGNLGSCFCFLKNKMLSFIKVATVFHVYGTEFHFCVYRKQFHLKIVGKSQFFLDTETPFSDSFTRLPVAVEKGMNSGLLFSCPKPKSSESLNPDPDLSSVRPQASSAGRQRRRYSA